MTATASESPARPVHGGTVKLPERDHLGELAVIIRSGGAVLFTGAGFSADATGANGCSLPDPRQMIAHRIHWIGGTAAALADQLL